MNSDKMSEHNDVIRRWEAFRFIAIYESSEDEPEKLEKGPKKLPKEIMQNYYSIADYFGYRIKPKSKYSSKDKSVGENKNCWTMEMVPEPEGGFVLPPFVAWYLGEKDALKDIKCSLPERIEDSYLVIKEKEKREISPNLSQKEAIREAFKYPVSIITGPPGTGKTETILNLASCVINNGMTIAVVSNNNSALSSIWDKMEEYYALANDDRRWDGTDEEKKRIIDLYNSYLASGNKNVRKKTRENETKRKHEGKSLSAVKSGDDPFSFDDLRKRPFVTSTIHSIKRQYKPNEQSDEPKEYLYDFVVIDECSQVNPLQGLAAVSMARSHVVLVGDANQLPPVYSQKKEEIDREIRDYFKGKENENERYCWISCEQGKKNDEKSFLEKASEILAGEGITGTLLNEHWRCPYEIINFCNKEVYGGELDIKTKASRAEIPQIRVLWFEGDYQEAKRSEEKKDSKRRNGKKDLKNDEQGGSHINRRQVSIFMDEELAQIKRFVEEGKSVAILTPYNAQINELSEAISRSSLAKHRDTLSIGELADRDDKPEDNRQLDKSGREKTKAPENPYDKKKTNGKKKSKDRAISDEGDDFKELTPILTIHKVQGHGFDVVYLLIVDDGDWEYPWSQHKRLINVALSRAKEQVCVITSSHLMKEDMQRALTGYYVEPKEQSDDPKNVDDQRFLQKFLQYFVDDYGAGDVEAVTELSERFGFHKARSKSVFDMALPRVQEGIKGAFLSGPEVAMAYALLQLEGVDKVYGQVGLKNIFEDENELSDKTIDFIICDKNGNILLGIEVDGVIHDNERNIEIDKNKAEELFIAAKETGRNCNVYRLKPMYKVNKDHYKIGFGNDDTSDGIRHYDMEKLYDGGKVEDGFCLLRIDTGKTQNEMEAIGKIIRQKRAEYEKNPEQALIFTAKSLSQLGVKDNGKAKRVLVKEKLIAGQTKKESENKYKNYSKHNKQVVLMKADGKQRPTECGAGMGIVVAYGLNKGNDRDNLYISYAFTERGEELLRKNLKKELEEAGAI